MTGKFLLVAMLAAHGFAADGLERAQKLYDHTNFRDAVNVLLPIANGNAAASELLGQSYFMLGEYRKASEHLEKAVAIDPSNANYQHWLGRAYGRRAETAFPMMAINYAGKARVSFEKAVQLDPNNGEAVNDLFEYYLQAPGMLGGGFDKASRIADAIAAKDPAEGVFAKARIAEERKDYSTAEAMLRRAIELAPRQPGRLVDLARFLAKRGRYEESDAAFDRARPFAPEAPRVLFSEASTYLKAHRKFCEARELLQQYLASDIRPDDPSKDEARRLLRQASGN
jgi:Tfp pilus assembly protein PilF